MERVFNFSAGPSMLPLPVLEQVQKDLVCYGSSGSSVMEMSHRSRPYEEIIERAQATLRRIMNIPDSYSVLFLQGGASLQFSMIPMNLAKRGATMDYAITGQFAEKAFEEAKRWGNSVAICSSKADKFSYVPRITEDMLSKNAAYLHITGNNTIFGTMYNELPNCGNTPLVCDLSSIILGREFDVRDFALIYAGAQKNMGPAGLTVVILKKELLANELENVVPTMLRYKTMADSDSMYNTPPCFSIYVAGLVFEWVEKLGGVAAMESINREKAAILYEAIDSSDMFAAAACKADRSIMNATFTLTDDELTKDFLKLCESRGMVNLKGHRSVGGCRASIYNAMPVEGINMLVKTMKDFEAGQRA
ncbi:MAG: 3-phosphoserine/phosphohydroxythreonine transaminase [Oscillospiraceae bacterium]